MNRGRTTRLKGFRGSLAVGLIGDGEISIVDPPVRIRQGKGQCGHKATLVFRPSLLVPIPGQKQGLLCCGGSHDRRA